MNVKFTRRLLVASLLYAAYSPLSAGLVSAGFDSGAGSNQPDQYPGMMGNGWTNAWGTGNLPSGNVTATLQASPPLNTGGNHLRVAITAIDSDSGMGRFFTNTDGIAGVDGSKPVTFEFNYRVDAATSGFSSNDYLAITNNAGFISSSGTATWMIRLVGGASPQWQVYNGNRDGAAYSPALLVNTGMAAAVGTTYSFTIVADPVSRSYTTTVSNGSTSVQVANMGFRTNSSNIGNSFGMFGKKDAGADTVAFAVDSLRISGETPETPPGPSTSFPVIFDMVHHNPGGALYQSEFNNAAFAKNVGYNGKVFFLFESAQLAVNWDEFNTVDKIILPPGSADRAWVDAKREEITAKYTAAKAEGLQVYCQSDLVLFPKRLVSLYGMSGTMGNVTHADTELWLRRLLKMMFTQYPQLDGIVVRIGETYLDDAPFHQGKIDNKTDPNATIIPLMNILRDEVCVKLGKKVIFRTWLSFDTDQGSFLSVSNAVAPHDNLTWSVKHVEGDFHRGNPYSKVLGQGRHPFIVEVQCAREYEGKGAFPNYIANGVIEGFEEHSSNSSQKLRHLWQNSPLMRGVWTWSRGGGWEGPYIQNELWCEMNAWVMAQWALNPAVTELSLFHRFATERLGLPAAQLTAFRELARLSAEAVWRAKRGTNNALGLWWCRDQYYLYPWLPSNSAEKAQVLADQNVAITKFERIVEIAKTLTPADPADREFMISSSLYGLHFMRILQAVKNMVANEGVDSLKLKAWLDRHDEAWADFVSLASLYPDSISSPYVKNALRSSGGENPTTAEPRIRGTVNSLSDSDGDGLVNIAENAPSGVDSDNDGLADYLDADSDNDGVTDAVEIGRYWDDLIDSNLDGTPDFRDADHSPQEFLKWRQNYFKRQWSSENLAGWTANPDEDLFVNGLEYALMGNPTVRNAALSSYDGASLKLGFRRNPDAADVTLDVMTSTGLDQWKTVVRSIGGRPFSALIPGWSADESGGVAQVFVGSETSAPDSMFLRIGASLNGP